MIRVSAMGLVAASALAAAVILGWSRPRSITEADEKPAKGLPTAARLVVLALGGVLALVAMASVGSLQWGIAIAAIGVTAVTLWRETARRRDTVRNRAAVVEACQALAGQLRIGQIPAVALENSAVDCHVLASASAAQSVGGDVVEALRAQAEQSGCDGLGRLAAAWALCDRTGASMVRAANQVAESLQVTQTRALSVEAELAAPRATGWLLALLPIVGVGMGYVAGGDPIAFLLGTPGGQWCVSVAVVLMCAGLVWVTRLARA